MTLPLPLPFRSFNFQWVVKYKLYHLPFWFAYHYVFWVMATGSIKSLFSSPYAFKFAFYVVFQAVAVYFNLYVLIPRYLQKGKYVPYIAYCFLTIVCAAVCIIPGYHLSAWSAGKTFHEAFQREPTDFFYFLKTNTLPSTLASITLGMSVKLTKNWVQSQRREQLLQKEKLETELKFLRAQFNPHFLFNTINSIFVLINKNPAMASESLAKFSDLLRYQLYECNEHQIALSKELSYLHGFVELEKLRLNTNVCITLQMQPPHTPDLAIAPFILMPFIENAFKHVSQSGRQTNRIDIHIAFQEQKLNMVVSNTVNSHKIIERELLKHSGVGLQNVQRRLELLYSNEYELKIDKNEHEFTVSLGINLRELKIKEPAPVPIN